MSYMYIPQSEMASKALAGLDQSRRDFVNHLADRLCVLPREDLDDDKRVKSEMMLELQGRFTPEEAARISFTSTDVIISIALSVVRDRHESVLRAKRLSLAVSVFIGLVVSVAVIAVFLFLTQEPPKPLKVEVRAEPKSAAPVK